MKERNMTIFIVQARNWFNSGNKQLQELALQVFDRKELTSDFRHIVTFKDACEALGLRVARIVLLELSVDCYVRIEYYKTGCDLSLTRAPKSSYLYYPYNPFMTSSSTYYDSEFNSGEMEVIGKIKSEGEEYNILGGKYRRWFLF